MVEEKVMLLFQSKVGIDAILMPSFSSLPRREFIAQGHEHTQQENYLLLVFHILQRCKWCWPICEGSDYEAARIDCSNKSFTEVKINEYPKSAIMGMLLYCCLRSCNLLRGGNTMNLHILM